MQPRAHHEGPSGLRGALTSSTGRLVVVLGACLALVLAAVAIAATRGGGDAASEARRPAASRHPLTWAPPALDAPETVRPTTKDRRLDLDPGRDYVVQMPATPLDGPGGLTIRGGRNVVLIGGDISVSRSAPGGYVGARRGLMLSGQTGTVHIEGLLIHGKGLSEGINLAEPFGATVQLQNIRVATVRADDERTFSDNHPDVLQTWAGPANLRVDGLTGATDYQGFFLHPYQFPVKKRVERFEFKRVNIRGTPTARYLLWQATRFPLHASEVFITSRRVSRKRIGSLWPRKSRTWSRVRRGVPSGGDFVPAGVAGSGYQSPGYRTQPSG